MLAVLALLAALYCGARISNPLSLAYASGFASTIANELFAVGLGFAFACCVAVAFASELRILEALYRQGLRADRPNRISFAILPA